jgi:hypothetical protein
MGKLVVEFSDLDDYCRAVALFVSKKGGVSFYSFDLPDMDAHTFIDNLHLELRLSLVDDSDATVDPIEERLMKLDHVFASGYREE